MRSLLPCTYAQICIEPTRYTCAVFFYLGIVGPQLLSDCSWKADRDREREIYIEVREKGHIVDKI